MASNIEIQTWLTAPLTQDIKRSLRRMAESDDVHHVAVMPDVHLSNKVCNGVAVATKELIYPQAIGNDIGCGMLAVAINLSADALSSELVAGRLLGGLYRSVPSIKHLQSKCQLTLPDSLNDMPLSHDSLEKCKQRDGVLQMGTLGRGNHFLEFQADIDGRLWLMLHTGSRGMGQTIADHHLREATFSGSGLLHLPANSASGQNYLSDLDWAIEYASQNRLAIARSVELLMADLFETSLDWPTLIHSNHNHVKRETIRGSEYWIHRKGCLSAKLDEPGVIPGSMGTCSFHVTGRGLAQALESSSHGAGRRLARGEAMRQISLRDFHKQTRNVWIDRRRADSLRDEAPSAYKDIDRVMRAQRKLTCIVRSLRPVLSYKGISSVGGNQ